MVSSPYSLVCATTHCLFSLDLITLIVEDSKHKKPLSADIRLLSDFSLTTKGLQSGDYMTGHRPSDEGD